MIMIMLLFNSLCSTDLSVPATDSGYLGTSTKGRGSSGSIPENCREDMHLSNDTFYVRLHLQCCSGSSMCFLRLQDPQAP